MMAMSWARVCWPELPSTLAYNGKICSKYKSRIMRNIVNGGITRGKSSVFDDLGYPDAAERQTKTRLALAVNELLKTRKLKQQEIADLLHIPQPKVSALKNYRLDQFSVERLMEFLTALNHDVEIMIRPRIPADVGHISVSRPLTGTALGLAGMLKRPGNRARSLKTMDKAVLNTAATLHAKAIAKSRAPT